MWLSVIEYARKNHLSRQLVEYNIKKNKIKFRKANKIVERLEVWHEDKK